MVESMNQVVIGNCLDCLVSIGKNGKVVQEVMDVFHVKKGSVSEWIVPRMIQSCLDCLRVLDSKERGNVAREMWESVYQLLHIELIVEQMKREKGTRRMMESMLNLITRSMDSNLQNEILRKMHTHQSLPTFYIPLLLLQSLLCNAKKEVEMVQVYATPLFIFDLISFYFSIVDRSEQRLILPRVCIMIASFINKNMSREECRNVIEKFQNEFMEKTIRGSLSFSFEKKSDVMMMYAWIAKGFIVRADLKGLEMVTFLISMLGNEEMAECASNSLQVVMKDDEEGFLTKESFGQVKVLFKQRLYHHSAPLLIKGFEHAESGKNQVAKENLC